jgi:hypothetical protein
MSVQLGKASGPPLAGADAILSISPGGMLINAAHAGEYDGNEVATDGSDGFLYMYGPDADRLFEVIRPILEACSFMRGARMTLRYGPPSDEVRRREFVLGS